MSPAPSATLRPILNPTQAMPLVLASSSPRRRELIALGGWEPVLRPVTVDETPHPGETAAALTRRLALAKAEAARRGAPDGSLVIAADTIVAAGDDLLGKPEDAGQARAMLQRLRRRNHSVITTLAILGPDGAEPLVDVCTTEVPMRDYGDDEIDRFVDSGEAGDKAGAYGIQDPGFHPVDVEALRGCYANVMGLPLCHVVRTLRRRGLEPERDVPTACRTHTGYDCPVFPQILAGQP